MNSNARSLPCSKRRGTDPAEPPRTGDRPRTLLYLFWEPTNVEDVAEFRTHRDEVKEFADLVNRCATRLVFLSYPDLWRNWERHSTWPGMPDHLARLRERYSFAIE